jgi:hypothetical protein
MNSSVAFLISYRTETMSDLLFHCPLDQGKLISRVRFSPNPLLVAVYSQPNRLETATWLNCLYIVNFCSLGSHSPPGWEEDHCPLVDVEFKVELALKVNVTLFTPDIN